MDNAQKAIMIGVGLFITIIIISAVMLITSAGQDMVDNSMTKLSDISNQLSSSEWSSLDGKYMNGSQVISYVKKYYNSNDFLCYYVSTSSVLNRASRLAGDNVTIGNYTSVTKTSNSDGDIQKIGNITEPSETKYYISATANYQAQIIKTQSGDNIGVIFLKK